MFKTLIFATVATLSLAQDYPKPVVPNDFVAESIHYTYANNRLAYRCLVIPEVEQQAQQDL